MINLKNSFSRIGAAWPAGHSWCPGETGGCVSAVTRRIAAGMSSNLRLSVCLSLRLSISGGGRAAPRLDQVAVPPIPSRCLLLLPAVFPAPQSSTSFTALLVSQDMKRCTVCLILTSVKTSAGYLLKPVYWSGCFDQTVRSSLPCM